MIEKLVRWSAATLALALVAVGLGACGGSSDDNSNDQVAEDPVTVTEAPPSPEAGAAVCDGTPNDAAPNYERGDGLVAVYQKDQGSSDYAYNSYLRDLPEGSVAEDPNNASVIVCLDITKSEVVDTCNYTDEQTGDDFNLEIANATYNVTIYEAQSARQIESDKDLEGEVRDCPAAATFTEGETSMIDYGRPAAELQALLEPIAIGGL